MKNIRIEKKGNFPRDSAYESGKTILDVLQVELLEEFSELIYGNKENYDILHNGLAPKGIVVFLEDQIAMRIREGELNNTDIAKGKAILHQLKRSFSL